MHDKRLSIFTDERNTKNIAAAHTMLERTLLPQQNPLPCRMSWNSNRFGVNISSELLISQGKSRDKEKAKMNGTNAVLQLEQNIEMVSKTHRLSSIFGRESNVCSMRLSFISPSDAPLRFYSISGCMCVCDVITHSAYDSQAYGCNGCSICQALIRKYRTDDALSNATHTIR